MSKRIDEVLFEDLKAELRLYDVKDVAESAGVAPSTLYFWLADITKRPYLRTVMLVADAIGLDLKLERRSKRLQKAA